MKIKGTDGKEYEVSLENPQAVASVKRDGWEYAPSVAALSYRGKLYVTVWAAENARFDILGYELGQLSRLNENRRASTTTSSLPDDTDRPRITSFALDPH